MQKPKKPLKHTTLDLFKKILSLEKENGRLHAKIVDLEVENMSLTHRNAALDKKLSEETKKEKITVKINNMA